MKISVQMVVKNEERWIWYAIMSVIDHVDEIIIYDTGSTDKTIEIIKSISNPKIHFRRFCENVDAFMHTQARQDMFKRFKYDWILVVDGDEVWTEASIKEICAEIRNNGDNYEYLVSPFLNMIGDVYHYQDSRAGKYKIGEYCGHITIRAINTKKIPGLHIDNPFPGEGFYDVDNRLIQDRRPINTKIMNNPYLHMTHLKRSSQLWNYHVHRNVQKYELGINIPPDFEYPKCFYMIGPANPWTRRNWKYLLNAAWQSPLREIKRILS